MRMSNLHSRSWKFARQRNQMRQSTQNLRTSLLQSGLRALLPLLIICALSLGCSRAFYRRQADADAYALVRQKANNPAWALENYTISVDPRSRMYDPFCLDAPPMPPDDPTAHQYMHCVDNKRGYPGWH